MPLLPHMILFIWIFSDAKKNVLELLQFDLFGSKLLQFDLFGSKHIEVFSISVTVYIPSCALVCVLIICIFSYCILIFVGAGHWTQDLEQTK